LEIQLNIDQNEKPKDKLAADHFFSSLLGTRLSLSSLIKKIPVYAPVIDEQDMRYVADAMKAGDVSGTGGEYLERFEADFASYCSCRHGVATSSGTTALHLALAALGIGPGDEVLASTFTNMATFFAVVYAGAHPVPIDIESDTWNLDPRQIESKITSRTRALLVVHIYGHPVDMDPVLEVARRHNLAVIEDAAEAHGALYKGRKAGSLGDIACFSFYANKILTTGEGGMVTTSRDDLAARARLLRGLAYGTQQRFMHRDVGFNYRLTNLQAALGCAQLQKIDSVIAAKRRVACLYDQGLESTPGLQRPVEKPYARSVYWMYHVVLRERLRGQREKLLEWLAQRGIETREAFIPYNMQQIFIDRGWTRKEECPVANDVAQNGFYLPSSPRLSEEDIHSVTAALRESISSI